MTTYLEDYAILTAGNEAPTKFHRWAAREKDYQKITREVLRELAETQRLQRETEKEFGDSGLVQSQLDRLRGTKQKVAPPAYQPPMVSYASEVVEAPKASAGNDQKPPHPSN